MQTGGRPTQETAGNFQAGSSVDLSTDNTSNILNQAANTGKLNVSVAGTGSKVSTEAPKPVGAGNTGVSAAYIIIPLLFLIACALFLAYWKARRFSFNEAGPNPAEMELLEETVKTIKTKKKRKKPKRPHHH